MKKCPSHLEGYIYMHSVAESFEREIPCVREMEVVRQSLQAQTLNAGKVPSLRAEDRNLSACHRNERGARCISLYSEARWPELEDVSPKIPFFTLAVPLKLAQRRREIV